MFHDSDDEPLSGDEERYDGGSAFKKVPVVGKAHKRKHSIAKVDKNKDGIVDKYKVTKNKTSNSEQTALDHGRKSKFRKFNIHPVIVLDYDLTLVDKSSRPFSGSHEFIEKLNSFNDGQNQLILYSHGSPSYVYNGLEKHYDQQKKYFDHVVGDNSARRNKPVSVVRRLIKDMEYLIGPYIIIDDMDTNLDSDQYDIVIDVARMTNYDDKGRAVSVDYDACLCYLDENVKDFLKTKKNTKV